jgi:ATP-dependent Lhr-like helicase
MEALWEEYDWVEPNKTFLIAYDDGSVVWWTFAGKLVNAAIATVLGGEAEKVASDNLSVSFSGAAPLASLRDAIKTKILADPTTPFVPLDEKFVDELKFGACLPPATKEKELAERYDISLVVRQLSEYPLVAIGVHE